MLQAPTPEIEAEVFAEYDRDYVAFNIRIFEDMERTNPGLADLLFIMKDYEEQLPGVTLGLQMSCAVYEQLKRAANGSLPIVEMRPALKEVGMEALADPEAFVDKYGTPYFHSGLIGKWTLSACIGDAVGNGVDVHMVVFVVVFLLRILEAQVELDIATPSCSRM